MLYHGDCIDKHNLIADKSVDLIFTDLPYGTTNCVWDCPIDLSQLWIQYKRIIKDNGCILLNAQTPFDKVLGASNLPMLRYEWIWEKTSATGHLNAKRMPMKAHENILVFYNNLPTYNPQKTTGHKRKVSTAIHKRNCKESDVYGKVNQKTGYDSTERYPRSVLLFKSDKQKLNLHSTQKPRSLADYFIKTYSNEGDIVLDSCMGSGTYGKSATELNRNFIGIEKDLIEFKKAVARIKG